MTAAARHGGVGYRYCGPAAVEVDGRYYRIVDWTFLVRALAVLAAIALLISRGGDS